MTLNDQIYGTRVYKGFERFNGERERETPASLLLPMVATTAQAQYQYTTIAATTRPRTMKSTRRIDTLKARMPFAIRAFRVSYIEPGNFRNSHPLLCL